MMPALILHLFAAIPVFHWPMLVCELIRIAPEIRASWLEGRGGWIEYDRNGRLFLVHAPAPPPHWSETIAAARALAARLRGADRPLTMRQVPFRSRRPAGEVTARVPTCPLAPDTS